MQESVTGKRKQHNNSSKEIIILIKSQLNLTVTSIANKCVNRQGCNTLYWKVDKDTTVLILKCA